MKAKIAIVVLIVVSVFLGLALMNLRKTTETQKAVDDLVITNLTSDLKQLSAKHEEQKQVNIVLTNMVTTREGDIVTLTNTLNLTRTELASAKDLAEANARASASNAQRAADFKASLDKEAAEVVRLKADLDGLTAQRDSLTLRMGEMTNAIKSLEGRITDVQKQLSSAKGESEFLLKELKRLQAEKAELERQLNDLAFLKEQVHKLKEELSAARRLDWIRRGLYEEHKGMERLFSPRTPVAPPKTNFNLDVKLKLDGTSKITSPVTNAAPVAPVAPAK